MAKITDLLTDNNLFAPWFKIMKSWASWIVFLKAIFAIQMTADELAIYKQCTNRSHPPKSQVKEAWLVVGRRGGKSFIVSIIAVYIACFIDFSKYLSPGENGTVMILANDRKQSRVIMRYIKALLNNIPLLKRMIIRQTTDSIELNNNIIIEVHTSSFRAVRGYTVVCALCDETAFWRSEESANPDIEILNALKPAMATIPNAMLLCISSPYARRGALYEAHRDYYGKDVEGILVWQASSQTMNPTIPQKVIDDAYERDPTAAAAEYGAQFRSDVSAFISESWLSGIAHGSALLSPIKDVNYVAFCDPSGGAKDSFTLAISHTDNDMFVLDVVASEKPPFNPASVVSRYVKILREYGVTRVTGDRYAGVWVSSEFEKHGIEYIHSELSKSQIYLECEPLFATGRIELLDNKTLFTELRQLERRTGTSGRDRIDHPPGGHDDVANAACGALWLCSKNITLDNPELVAEMLSINKQLSHKSNRPTIWNSKMRGH